MISNEIKLFLDIINLGFFHRVSVFFFTSADDEIAKENSYLAKILIYKLYVFPYSDPLAKKKMWKSNDEKT